jgi:simple sugar transport system ATP-binding protein
MNALSLETVGMTMRFGSFTALDDVSIRVKAGSFHALLGENGAGKSTLVKCIMGFYHPTDGQLMVEDREVTVNSPRDAASLGLGMVYQHFTLVPSMTGAENLVISRNDVASVINWKQERAALADFMRTMPFPIPLDRQVRELSAGEKQKLEIIRQLYLGRRLLILDEPTSVLTPAEADDMLGIVRDMTARGELSVIMISHKFHEVMKFADSVSVLRRGRLVGSGSTAELTPRDMAAMMIGDITLPTLDSRVAVKPEAPALLTLENVRARDGSGLKTIDVDGLFVQAGEIVGIAGISGNGQKELAEVLAGQRRLEKGNVRVKGATYTATRSESRTGKLAFIPEEPLQNACVAKMTVAENLGLRRFDIDEKGRKRFWLSKSRIKQHATDLVSAFKVKTASLETPIGALSGGNVQRAVLARELSGDVDVLIVSNPCFGLDFSAVAEIRARIMKARNNGTAVLLFSEDLDELMALSDRIFVMSEGRLVYETQARDADLSVIGAHMAGHAA